MARHPQVDGDTRNPKLGCGSRRLHGQTSSEPSASTGRQTTFRFNWVLTLLLSNNYAKLSRLNIAREIHNTCLRRPMLRLWLRRFKAQRLFWTGGEQGGNESPQPKPRLGLLPVCGVILTSPPQAVRIVHLRGSEKQPPKWWLHTRSNMTTFYTFARSVDALSRLRCVCRWSYYTDINPTIKTHVCPRGAG